MNSLTVTSKMRANARDNKCVGWLEMNPLDFLRLTTTDPNVFDWIRQEENDTKPLSQYNKFASSGKTVQMPWLDVDLSTGKVCGHEGRHRAVATYVADSRNFPVAICLRDRGYATYFTLPYPDPRGRVKKYMTKEDVPTIFIGQFVHREVEVTTASLVEFWAD